MFLYIKENTIIAKSNSKLQIGEDVIEFEVDNIVNPILENGKIIEYNNSEQKIIDENITPIIDLVKLKEEKKLLEDIGYIVVIKDNKIIKTETDITKSNKIKSEKKVAIEKIATLSDQLNLIASVLDTITSENPDQELIASAKTTFAEIKTILSN